MGFKGSDEELLKDLESRSKQSHELVVTEDFSVEEVIAESYAISFTPNSEMIIGGVSPIYDGGFTSRLVLKVMPANPQASMVKTLTFNGVSAVRAGDCISAKIPRYEEKVVKRDFFEGPYDNDRVFYLDREFKPEESAIEILILGKDRKAVRIDRAVEYTRILSRR